MSPETREVAERLAARMIRSALDNAVTPDCVRIGEQTGLSSRAVSDLRDRMLSGKREHQTPHPAPASPAPGGPRLTVVADPEPWRKAGADHPDKTVRQLHAKAVAAVVAVEAALAEYARTAGLRRRAEDLEAELAQVRAQLGDGHLCQPCGKAFTSSQALHRTRKHPAPAP